MGTNNSKNVFENSSFHSVIDIEFPLQSIREYIKLTDQLIENEIKSVIEENNNLLKLGNSDDYDFFDPVDHGIKIQLRQLYYHSIFISLYSLLEKTMFKLCKAAEPGFPLKVTDISGEGIFKYHKYICKVLNIDMSILNTEWSAIVKYNKLRNRLVHSPTNQVEKTESNTQLITTLRSIKHLEMIDKGDYYEFDITDKMLLLEFHKTISNFLHGIYWEKRHT